MGKLYARIFVLFAMTFFTFSVSAEDSLVDIRIRPPQSENDISHHFFRQLISAALVDNSGYRVVVESIDNLTQDRGFQLLKQKRLDLYWAGVNPLRVNQFRVVGVPLTMGLLGYRLPVIKRKDIPLFNSLDENQLKDLRACQGSQWPDSDILEHNGYRVIRSPKFKMMYRMLSGGRCHYFPRGLNEVYGEVASFEDLGRPDDLIVYERLILKYRLPMVFFVHKDNEHLAMALEQGLRNLVDSGRLKQFLTEHPVTQDAFPLSRFSNSQLLELDNPLLNIDLPEDSKYWLEF